MFLLLLLWRCLVLIAQSGLTEAAIVSRTIDDTAGDSATGQKPIYVPADRWQDSSCSGCRVQPQPLNQAFKGTYHALTSNPEVFDKMTIQLSFKGTAIYVYFILANNVDQYVTTETSCDFTLDGNGAGSFVHSPTSSSAYDFKQLVFQREDLPNDDHTLLISASKGPTDRYGHSYISFDYAMYTFDDTPPPSPPPPLPPSSPQSSTSTSSSTTSGSSTSTSASPTSTSSATSQTQPSISTGVTTRGSPPLTSKGGAASLPPDPTSTTSQSPGTTSIPSNRSHSFPIGAVVGGIVGAIALLFIILLLLWCRRRRGYISQKRQSDANASFTIDGLSSDTRELDHSDRSRVGLPVFNAAERLLPASEGSSGGSEAYIRRLVEGERQKAVGGNSKEPYRAASPPTELRPVRREGHETVQMRTQLHAMAREIEYLQSQLNSNPTQTGQPHDPPPEYATIT